MARGSVLLVAANGRRVERVALAGERVLVEHDGSLVALVTVDGERLWDGHPQAFMSDAAFVVDPAGRRAVVYGGERLQVLDLGAGRVIAEADSMSAIRCVDFDGERVVWTVRHTPFDWGELDLWQVGGEKQQLAGETGTSSAVAFHEAELVVADGATLCRYDLTGARLGQVDVDFSVERVISLGTDGVLAAGHQVALVDPRNGAVRWAPPAVSTPQRFVVARDGRRLVRLPGLVHTHAAQIAESFVVGSDASRTVSAPPGVDWGDGAWLDAERVALFCGRAIYRWDVGSGACDRIAELGPDVTALDGAGARIVAGCADGSVVLL